MSDQQNPRQTQFQGYPMYNQQPRPTQQPSQTQSFLPPTEPFQQPPTESGYPQLAFPSQPQYMYPQQTLYTTGQFTQTNTYTPPPPPPLFQQIPANPSKDGFFKKKVSIPVWTIALVLCAFAIAFVAVFEAASKTYSTPVASITQPTVTDSSNASMPSSTPVPSTIPTSIPTTIPTSAPTSAPTLPPSSTGPSKVGDTITVSGVSCTLISVQTLAGDGYTEPKPGDTFIVVHVKLVNNSGSDFNYYSIDFKSIDGSGNATDTVAAPTTYTANNEIDLGTLISGGSLTGDLVFEVPAGDHKAELSWQPGYLSNTGDNVWNLGL